MRCRWVLKKKIVRGKLGKCQHLKAFAKKKCIFPLLKVSFEAPSRFYFNFFYDLWSWLAGKKKKKARCTAPWMPRDRTWITRQRRQKAYQCVEKIIYIFCGSFYYYDSLAYGVGVMWKISIRACLHGVGDPGLVGLVSFVFTLWNWNPYSAVIKKIYASKKVKEKALAPEGKFCRPENNNYSQSI